MLRKKLADVFPNPTSVPLCPLFFRFYSAEARPNEYRMGYD